MELVTFARFAEALPEAMLLVDGQGCVRAANAAAAALLGRDAPGLSGTALAGLTHDGPDAVAALLRAGARSRRPLPGALRWRLGDGGALDTRCEVALLEPRHGDRPSLILLRVVPRQKAASGFLLLNQRIEELSREVARRRSAELQVQAYAERLRVTLGSIGDAVIATDAGGRITLMNGVAQQLTGWPEGEASGRPLAEVFVIIGEHSRERVESPVDKVLRDGVTVGLANHTLLVARDGRELPIDDSAAAIHDDRGALVGAVLVFRDFTERHALERELRRRSEDLLEAARRKDEFLSMLAHELRNPLAPLRTGLHVLLHTETASPGVARVATMMQRQLGHMTRLVDDLLDVARLTHGKIELQMQPVSLAAVLQQAVEMLLPQAEERRQRLTLEPLPACLAVRADATRMVQVFGNLLANAVKFTPPGGRITVFARQEADCAVAGVRDDGAGIDPVLLPKVFDLFTQGDRSLDRAQGGLGIGLTIVRSLVERHGGQVHAHSDGRGLGTVVTVRLPLLDSPLGPAGSGGPAAPPYDVRA